MARSHRLASLKAKAKREGWLKAITSEADERALLNGYRYDSARAGRVVSFFGLLRHAKGKWAGQPFELPQWQLDFVEPLFGWVDEAGRRRYRQAYLEVAKKNGKSTLCSGLALYLLMGDGEPAAEVYSAAADREQAGIVYREAKAMVEASSALRKRLEVKASVKRILHPASASFYRVLSREAGTSHGINIHGLIFDELHTQKTRELSDALRWGGASRTQPLFVYITTAGHDEDSICWEKHEYAQQVADGVIHDDRFLGQIYALDEGDDWTDETSWPKANPSWGITIDPDDFAAECQEAQNSPRLANSFKRLRLNVWTPQETLWLSLAQWDRMSRKDPIAWLHRMRTKLQGQPCLGGLDLSSTTDLSCLVLLFEHRGKMVPLPWFWLPQAAVDEVTDVWVRQGLITATPGNVIDYDWILDEIAGDPTEGEPLAAQYDITEIGFDPWNATQLAVDLEREAVPMTEVRQSYRALNEPSKLLESLVLSGKLDHGGHPVMRWCANNVAVATDPADNIRPIKSNPKKRIDGILATVIALSRQIATDESEWAGVV